jgi:hypothetical protein
MTKTELVELIMVMMPEDHHPTYASNQVRADKRAPTAEDVKRVLMARTWHALNGLLKHYELHDPRHVRGQLWTRQERDRRAAVDEDTVISDQVDAVQYMSDVLGRGQL